MTSIAIVLIMTIISMTSGRVEINTDLPGDARGISYKCPSVISTEYDVTVISDTPLIAGCAQIVYDSNDTIKQSYNLWFGNERHRGQDCHDPRMDYFHFNCLAKELEQSKDTSKGLMYLRLYNDDFNKTLKPDYKCALFEAVNGNLNSFRIAVSENISCNGLFDVLYPPQMIPESNKGSMLLLFKRKQVDLERKRRDASSSIIDGDDGHGNSPSNVKSKSKTDVPVLAGISPYTLLVVNRVSNKNSTGIIKYTKRLWNDIIELFTD
ncbi:hypothetical protein AGLY_012077 [Aphis glycines]|uniref:Uncharacterized protein n=1 Tax=Aphis glycines TaxID=307491 RepID=A0A6G0T980_APHGL|nr:hypothetical protein AGLY_012077 [Aphis glycines]